MKTRLDCLPCLLNQGLKGARLSAPENQEVHKKILFTWASRLPSLDLNQPPPVIAGELYADISTLLGTPDPFIEDKKTANIKALELLPRLQEIVEKSRDPLAKALEISIIGNYIDSGVAKDFHWEEKLKTENQELDRENYSLFRQRVQQNKKIMILGDNAGEIALDTILVSQLQKMDCQVTYVVRDKPIINDATLEDAELTGMTELCRVISSGVRTPGTVLSNCSPEFLEKFYQTPIILSKGQGNFEALSEESLQIFFAFKIKCQVVADLTGQPEGKSALVYL